MLYHAHSNDSRGNDADMSSSKSASDLSFEDMVRLDSYYVDNWSLGLDIRIIFRTFFAMVGRKGAY